MKCEQAQIPYGNDKQRGWRRQGQKQIPCGNDKGAWEGAFPSDATLAIYMPGRRVRELADELIASGVGGAVPCVAVSKATPPEQQVHWTTLAEIEDADLGPAPVLLLIGHAIRPPAALERDRTQP